MKRQDQGLAHLLRYENIAWYEEGRVRILDRRVYPYEKISVECTTHQEVAQAIRDMVTQSGGPYLAAQMGMALAAFEARNMSEEEQREYLKKASHTLANARPTTAKKMEVLTAGSLAAAETAWAEGKDPVQAVKAHAIDTIDRRYSRIRDIAVHLVNQFPEHGVVMTQCFAETIVGMMALEAGEQKRNVRFICPETRPYLQGARLTASVLADMGYSVHVISDNMPAWIMGREGVDLFTSAADVITMDGHVVNKVGTLQIALAAQYHGIPYFVTGTPDEKHASVKDIIIEERDVEQVKRHMGRKVTEEGVEAYYPAFDITPPKLCNGVVTPLGIFSSYDLHRYSALAGVSEVVV